MSKGQCKMEKWFPISILKYLLCFPAQTQGETKEEQLNRQDRGSPGPGLETTDLENTFTCCTPTQVAKIQKGSHFPIPSLKKFNVVHIWVSLYVQRAA